MLAELAILMKSMVYVYSPGTCSQIVMRITKRCLTYRTIIMPVNVFGRAEIQALFQKEKKVVLTTELGRREVITK